MIKRVYTYKIEALENGYLLTISATNQVSKQFCFSDLAALRGYIHEDLRSLVVGEEESAEKERQEEGECCECRSD